MSYVIRFNSPPNTYNLNHGFNATLAEATRYPTFDAAQTIAEDLVGVDAILEFDDEVKRLSAYAPITRDQLIVAIQNATEVLSIYDDRGRTVQTIRYVDPTFLIKAIQELS